MKKGKIRLNTKDRGNSVEAYATRAKSALFKLKTSTKPLTTFEAFETAANYAPSGKKYWLQNLAGLSIQSVNEILYKIPDDIISQPAREFALEIIKINKTRLLENLENPT